jgi:hypothetical protein
MFVSGAGNLIAMLQRAVHAFSLFLAASVFAALAVRTGPARASEGVLTITTWNLQHLMSKSRFEEWVAFCSRYGWSDVEAERRMATRPEWLTYCDANSGLLWPSDSVRESAPVRSSAAMAQKASALRARATALASDIFALQEVSDADAVAEVFPRDLYDIFATEAQIPQNIAFAVRKGGHARPIAARQIDALAKRDSAGRAVRPGLELVVEVAGMRLTLLNVHLKAGCRSQVIDAPDVSGARDEQHKADIIESCRVLRSQIPELEQWLDAQLTAGALPIILGDFNRDLSGEVRRKLPARLDGSDPRAPVSEATRIGSLLFEISDGEPAGSRMTFVRADIQARDKRVKNPGSTRFDRVCHDRIDQFLISGAVEAALKIDARGLVASGADYGDDAYGPDRVLPSDHCPHTLRLTW